MSVYRATVYLNTLTKYQDKPSKQFCYVLRLLHGAAAAHLQHTAEWTIEPGRAVLRVVIHTKNASDLKPTWDTPPKSSAAKWNVKATAAEWKETEKPGPGFILQHPCGLNLFRSSKTEEFEDEAGGRNSSFMADWQIVHAESGSFLSGRKMVFNTAKKNLLAIVAVGIDWTLEVAALAKISLAREVANALHKGDPIPACQYVPVPVVTAPPLPVPVPVVTAPPAAAAASIANIVPDIRARHSQLGLSIEARHSGGDWITVQLRKYAERSNPNRPYPSYISPAEDEREYFAQLDGRGIKYRRVAYVPDSAPAVHAPAVGPPAGVDSIPIGHGAVSPPPGYQLRRWHGPGFAVPARPPAGRQMHGAVGAHPPGHWFAPAVGPPAGGSHQIPGIPIHRKEW